MVKCCLRPVLNLTLVVARCNAWGIVFHSLIPLYIGLHSIPFNACSCQRINVDMILWRGFTAPHVMNTSWVGPVFLRSNISVTSLWLRAGSCRTCLLSVYLSYDSVCSARLLQLHKTVSGSMDIDAFVCGVQKASVLSPLQFSVFHHTALLSMYLLHLADLGIIEVYDPQTMPSRAMQCNA